VEFPVLQEFEKVAVCSIIYIASPIHSANLKLHSFCTFTLRKGSTSQGNSMQWHASWWQVLEVHVQRATSCWWWHWQDVPSHIETWWKLWSTQLHLSGHLHMVIKECAHKCNPHFDTVSIPDLKNESILDQVF